MLSLKLRLMLNLMVWLMLILNQLQMLKLMLKV